ncbi:FERM and PDZ domain-containing protein 4 [Liparis tanakae]|uniref:FERM and PDZ domain-containing protein 4 n=1 Tax=Liparis tanakae TaxID=230148 RepID=A0A4Z2G541_9TELE|nr:FERM and PDZ domain-containing protein 4 [Liparis tanakae]
MGIDQRGSYGDDVLLYHKNKMSGWPPPGPGSWAGLQGPPFSWDGMNSAREGRDSLTKYVPDYDEM